MKTRALLIGVLLAAAAGLSGCVIYPEPVAVVSGPPVVVRPGPYHGPGYYGRGYREYRGHDNHRSWGHGD